MVTSFITDAGLRGTSGRCDRRGVGLAGKADVVVVAVVAMAATVATGSADAAVADAMGVTSTGIATAATGLAAGSASTTALIASCGTPARARAAATSGGKMLLAQAAVVEKALKKVPKSAKIKADSARAAIKFIVYIASIISDRPPVDDTVN